jgi:hypothetical protein
MHLSLVVVHKMGADKHPLTVFVANMKIFYCLGAPIIEEVIKVS